MGIREWMTINFWKDSLFAPCGSQRLPGQGLKAIMVSVSPSTSWPLVNRSVPTVGYSWEEEAATKRISILLESRMLDLKEGSSKRALDLRAGKGSVFATAVSSDVIIDNSRMVTFPLKVFKVKIS